ncbi:MAG: hypothetical protein IJA23_05235 [Clostridia bacterium]|nr:hypothetical protein [Clostridia bacterium]
MNRNLLKIIAFVSMVIDHVGSYLLDNNIVFRIIGRLAFPIFAYFIAEGMKFTRNRKRYILLLFLFACISQVPYMLLSERFKLNVLFTFLLAILFILIIEKFMKMENQKNLAKMIGFMILILSMFIACLIVGDVLQYIEYGTLGIMLVVVFYFAKTPLNMILAALVLILMVLKRLLFMDFLISLNNVFQIFSLASIILIAVYNHKKGKMNLKYLFYVGYPAHLLLIWIITLFI